MKSSLRNSSLKTSKQNDGSSPNSVRWMPTETMGTEFPDFVITHSPSVGAAPLGSLDKLRRLRSRLRVQERRLFALSFPARVDIASQSQPSHGSVGDRFQTTITLAAQNVGLKKEQQKHQGILEKQAAAINSLQEELKFKDMTLDLLRSDLEQQRDHIAKLEHELHQYEQNDSVDLTKHVYLLRDVVAEVYRSQMHSSALPVEVLRIDGAESLASSGCSMKATVNAHFPLKERSDIKPESRALWSRHRRERRFLV